MATSIFERCGGFAVVRKVVSAFYDKVLDSPILEPHFENVDMRRLIDHQTKFIASAMGGPASFSDDMLARVHEPLGITKQEFDEMSRLFREALEDAGMEDEDVDQVHHQILVREHLIVTRVS